MLTVRVPADLMPAIVEAAERRGATRSEWIRDAIKAAADQGRRASAPCDRAA
ncbi:YlcI/YnfO family protein [Methylobacterium platani]|uniref:YlcI/YnfO family protein n=1 Tax=Methylobacterium platani TaxID=427683 RepID=UPI003CC91197